MKGIVKILTIWLPALLITGSVAGQGVGINTAGNNPNPSAILDAASTSQGMLTPRMTQAERDAIAGPATGLLIYQTDNRPGFRFYDGVEWVFLRGMTSIPGRIEINASCGVTSQSPSEYPPFSATFDCDNGTGSVSWPAGLFVNNPIVNVSSAVVDVPPPAPDIYCVPNYFAPCTQSFDADHLTGVRIYESTTGAGGPYSQIMIRTSGCDYVPGIGNYVAVPTAEATATLTANIDGCTDYWYRVDLRSSTEWTDIVQGWIDWNADGDFYDGENLNSFPVMGTSNGNWVQSAVFEVPAGTQNGNTVMRVRSLWPSSNQVDPCLGGTWGETEDYTLTITCANTGDAPEIPTICSVTNVTTTSFDFKCALLSGFPADPPMINYDLVPVE